MMRVCCGVLKGWLRNAACPKPSGPTTACPSPLIMDRHGLVTRQRHSRTKTEGTPLSQGSAPNTLWSTDYKGEFMLGDKRYCYPLTGSDHPRHCLLVCA